MPKDTIKVGAAEVSVDGDVVIFSVGAAVGIVTNIRRADDLMVALHQALLASGQPTSARSEPGAECATSPVDTP